jgi:predicted exporter
LRRKNQALKYSTLFFALGLAVHGADHWRRGFHVLTPEVFWAGLGVSILGVMAIVLVLMNNRFAPVLAVAVGFSTALGVAASHLLPRWSAFSDAFPGTTVSALSYTAVLIEIIGALLLGISGLVAFGHARAGAA